MIAKKVADKELARWNCLDYRPSGEENEIGLAEVRDALALASTDSAHCRQIVTEWLKRETKYPKPAQIYALGEELRERTSQGTAPQGCQLCEGTGWKHVDSINTINTAQGFCTFCSCGLGLWRKQKDRESKHA